MDETLEVTHLPKPLHELSRPEIEAKARIGRVTTTVLRFLAGELTRQGFEWALPVIFSKSTDPLWPDPGASIETRIEHELYGETVRTTLSMIIHKIIACSLVYPKFFVFSPNVRVERRERKATGWHLYEFTQLDFEVRDASSRDVRALVERTVAGAVRAVRREAREELVHLGAYDRLAVPGIPFEVHDREELQAEHGKGWEAQLPQEIREPVWVTNIPREFYDFEDPATGTWDNYDLFVPRYGEILSGARREWEYSRILAKMERDGVATESYALLLRLAREGKLRPSAGAGMGIERFVSWLVGASHIGEVQLFPKVPGLVYDL